MPEMPFGFWAAWALVLGASVGSFLNVVVHRLPRGESLWSPGSHCPRCREPIALYDNVPVLAWLWLRGRCRGCGVRISPRYPMVEALGASLALLCLWHFGITLEALALFALLAALLAVALIDWEHMIIPDGISLGFLVLGLVLGPITGPGIVGSLLGALVGGGLLLAVAWIWEKLRGVQAMGGGDIKLMAAVGAFLGPVDALLVIFVGAFLGSLFGVVLLRRGAQAKIAFGTFLSAAAYLVVFLGDPAVRWYLERLGRTG